MKNLMFWFVVSAAVLLVPSQAKANMLYWELYNPEVLVYDNGRISASTPLANLDPKAIGAKVIVFDADDAGVDIASREVEAYLDHYVYDAGSDEFVKRPNGLVRVNETGGTVDTWTDLGEYGTDDWMFSIAIFGDEGQIIALSEAVYYSEIAEYVSDSFGYSQRVDPWSGSGYVIPEPSSAVLALLGFAFLGLKRKQEVV